MGEEREIRKAKKEEMRSHLLANSDNGELQNELIHGGWKQQEVGEWPIDDTSSYISPMLVFTTFIAILGSFPVGFAVGYTSPVQSEIMTDLGLSVAEFSLFGSMLDIGSLVSALVCGKITDYLGRKRALQLADMSYILGSFAMAVAQGPFLLYLGRWMVGFAMTIAAYAVPVYIAEFTPQHLRGGFVVLHQLMITIGASIVNLIGLVISWRTLALIGIMPSLVQIVGLFFVPESPRWLMMIGRDEEVRAALQCIRGATADISQEAADMKDHAEALQQMSKVSVVQVFQRKYAYVLTVGIGISALSSLVGLHAVAFYSFSIFESAGFSGTVGTVVLAVVQLAFVVLAVILLDICGRRPLMMISAAGLCLGCLLAGFSFLLQDHHLLPRISPYFALFGLLMFAAAYPIGGGVSSVIGSEIYPINIKGLGGSLGGLAHCISGWIVSYSFNFLMVWSSSGTFFILAGICAFTLVFAAMLVPETKGRTLEEVQTSISHIWQ